MEEAYGRYTLLRRLAVGGMAEIFLASLHGDGGFEKKLVVKRILPHLGQDPDFVKMFIDEAVVAARLTHPNIVQVYDFGSVQGSFYIAMEYINGIDLHRILRGAKERKRILSFAEVAALGESIARGLSHTHNLTDDNGHSLSIVHRDVSPHNVIVSFDGDVKVMDFGIAKAAARATRTATGTLKGKLAYMSPEQAQGKGATKLSDQFALGIVLWECLTGKRLWEGDTDVSLIQTVINCEVPNMRDLRPDVPAALEAIIMRALQRDPADRYPDLADMQADLMSFHYALGAEGIVKLGVLAQAFKGETGENQSWSWADNNSPVGTRALPRPTGENAAASAGAQLVAQGTPIASPTMFESTSTGNTPMPAQRPTGPLLSAAMGSHQQLLPPPPPVRMTGSFSDIVRERPARRRTRDNRPTMRVRRPTSMYVPFGKRAMLSGGFMIIIGIVLPALWYSSAAAPRPAIAASAPPAIPLAMPPSPRVGTGHLTLSTDGPAVNVYLGSICLGQTPISDEEVPAGRLELRLVNESAGIWRNFEIEVPEGGVARGQVSSR